MSKVSFMKSIFILLSVCFVGLQASLAQGGALQSGNQNRISLSEALKQAEQNNLQVKQSQIQVQNASLNMAQAKNNKLPSLNGFSNLSTNFGRGIDFITNTYSNQTITNNNLGLSADLTLFQGGNLQNTYKQSALNLQATELDLKALKDNISLQVILAYLNVLNFEDQVEIAQNQAESTAEQLARTEKLVKGGAAAVGDQLDLKAQLAGDKATITNVKGQLANAKLNFTQLLNIENNPNLQFDRLDIPSIYALESYSAGQIFGLAQQFQPSVQAAKLRIESSRIGVKVAESALKPSLSLSGGMNSGYGSGGRNLLGEKQAYFKQLSNNFSQNIGLGLQVPIFNKYQTRTRIAQSKLQVINQELEAERNLQNLRSTIETAYTNKENAGQRLNSLNEQVQSLEEAFRSAQTRYNAGAINFVTYILQKNNLVQAKANQVQAQYELLLRSKVLEFYTNPNFSIK
jgi:outer membrane protein